MPEKRCDNCRHGNEGGIYIFCCHPDRRNEWYSKYRTKQAPAGGLPQSHDHVCPLHKFEKGTDVDI